MTMIASFETFDPILSLSFYTSLSLCIPLSFGLSIFFSLSLHLYLSLAFSLYLSLFISLFLYPSPSVQFLSKSVLTSILQFFLLTIKKINVVSVCGSYKLVAQLQATVGSILVLPVIQCYCGFLYVPIINTSFIIFVTLYGNRKECFTCTAVYCTSRSLQKATKTDWNVFLFAFPLIFSILNRIVPLSSASPLIQIIFICFLKKNFLYQFLNF